MIMDETSETQSLKKIQEIYVIGGRKAKNIFNTICWRRGSSSVAVWDPVTETDTALSFFSVCQLPNGFLISGGLSPTDQSSIRKCRQYNLVTKYWTRVADMQLARDRHGSVFSCGELVFIIGGQCREEAVISHSGYKEVDVFHIYKNRWEKAADLPLPVDRPNVVENQGTIYVLGGRKSISVLKLTCKDHQWEEMSDIPCVEGGINCAVVVRDHAYCAGKHILLELNLSTDAWSLLAPPPTLSSAAALVYLRGNLILLGGTEDTVNEPHRTIQQYSLKKNTWKVTENALPLALSLHFAFTYTSSCTDGMSDEKEAAELSDDISEASINNKAAVLSDNTSEASIEHKALVSHDSIV